MLPSQLHAHASSTPDREPGHEPALGVAFGGGGMRGWAHLGVIAQFDRLGLRPGVVAGTSAGALIGAYYAAGFSLHEMIQFMREQRTSSLFSLRFDGLGLLNPDAFRTYLHEHLGSRTFADLQVPLYVMATDLETGREVVIQSGRLVDAILASSAIPGIFPPVERDGRLLVDGGLSNNVPVSALVNAGARYTIAVRLHRDPDALTAPSLRRLEGAETADKRISLSMWTERMVRSIRRENSHLPNGFEVLGRAMEIVMTKLESHRLQLYRPDVLITPDVAHVGTLSFAEEKEEIFSCGVDAARAQEDALREIARRIG